MVNILQDLNDYEEIIYAIARFFPQIREQMCLETHFQYEFSIFWPFWAVGAAEKKIQTAISMLPLRPFFLCFHGQKK
jgi:hypothetical protein